MSKAEDELEAVLDSLAKWWQEYGEGNSVSVWIDKDGDGLAYDFDGTRSHCRVSKEYEPAGGNQTGSGK